jgi:hypothetical protein
VSHSIRTAASTLHQSENHQHAPRADRPKGIGHADTCSAEARKAADADRTVEEPGKFAAGVDPNLVASSKKISSAS